VDFDAAPGQPEQGQGNPQKCAQWHMYDQGNSCNGRDCSGQNDELPEAFIRA
jgi:hypothetical protein